MSDPLEEAYFRWLVDRVREDGPPKDHTYWDVLRLMFDEQFVWIVPNDDNRIIDGMDLRIEFLAEQDELDFLSFDRFGYSRILEVLVGISRRVAFLAEGSAEGWAWQLFCNLGLHKYRDPLSPRRSNKAREILHALVWRNYDPDGTGGFFPLAFPREDQTKVEIWYQMAAYVEEIHPEY